MDEKPRLMCCPGPSPAGWSQAGPAEGQQRIAASWSSRTGVGNTLMGRLDCWYYFSVTVVCLLVCCGSDEWFSGVRSLLT